METLVDSNLILEIEYINEISVKDQCLKMWITLSDKTKCILFFDYVWDFRYSIENACFLRMSELCHKEKEKSSVLMITNSEYIKYFERQVLGTRPISELKNYIVYDKVNTVVELLALKPPKVM